jgi:hypothetical protein
MRINLISVILVFAMTAVALAACADRSPARRAAPTAAPALGPADANANRAISLDEWDQFSLDLFEAVDRNGNGTLDAKELAGAFEAFDLNSDNVIERWEAPTLMDQMDKNSDGFIDRGEFGSFDWRRYRVDRNNDQLISPTEFRDSRRTFFDDRDLNRDTRLGPAELDDRSRFTLFRF